MRVLTALATAGFLSCSALAQPMQSRSVVIRSAEHSDPLGTIVIPAGSSLRLVSPISPNNDLQAAFQGRFTLSGSYEIQGYGEDAALSMWPDRKSRASLPHWQDRDLPEEMSVSNAWAFARAVVPKDKLRRLKNGTLRSVHGRVTIIADQYDTSIECDVVSASARFVAVVGKVQLAAIPQEEETC